MTASSHTPHATMTSERPAFMPCQDYPQCVNETKDAAAFHDWRTAMRFVWRRVAGQQDAWWRRKRDHRWSVRFDGRHWIVERDDGQL